MGTGGVLFVHGAGNRAEAAANYGAKLQAGLGLPANRFAISNWGVTTGPNLDRIGATMPDVPAGAFGIDPADLVADPYAALRQLPRADAAGAFAASNRDAEEILAFLSIASPDLQATGIPAQHLGAAAAEVASSPELAGAGGDSTARIDAAVTAALARSVQRQGDAAGAFPIDLSGAKAAIAKAIAGTGAMSAIGDFLGSTLGPPAALWVSQQVAPQRLGIMQDHMLVVADIMYYQRHGSQIRAHVREEIEAVTPPRLIIGHSLGGIILVDTLFDTSAAAPDIALLITFGSQSAFLQAIGALDNVKPSKPWLNIWSRYDFVSFLADGMWPGKVKDEPLDMDVGFPKSHGHYYDEPAFYELIRSHPIAKAIVG